MKAFSASDTITFINELISKGTGELRQLYLRYGIKDPISPQTLAAAIKDNGDAFRLELYSIAEKIQAKIPNSFTMVSVAGIDEFQGINEESITADLMGTPERVNENPTFETERKGINWESFNALLGNTVNLFGQINTATGRALPANPANPASTPNNTTQETSSGSKKGLLIIGAVVVVLAIVAFVIRRKRKA
jgi:hypothetical protein